jgi:hypothetical protein
LFDDADTQAGAPPVVVLSDGFWPERFEGEAAAIGRALVIDGLVHEIVGVTPSGFAFPEPAVGLRDDRQEIRLYTPFSVEPTPGSTVIDYTEAIARLKPGVTTAQAQAEGTAYARAVERPMADLVFGKGSPVGVRVRHRGNALDGRARPAGSRADLAAKSACAWRSAPLATPSFAWSSGKASWRPCRDSPPACSWRSC